VVTDTKTDSGPGARLKAEAGGLFEAITARATSSLLHKVEGATGRLTGYIEGDGSPGLIAAATGAKSMAEGKGPVRSLISGGMKGAKEKVAGVFGKRKKGGGQQKIKVTNIVESIDVGVPIRVAYNQWTQFREFPTFMKKVENIDQAEDQKLNWKAQVFWSHRSWEATIMRQHPDESIVWRSKGDKGHVDGAVTFHEVAPSLTRIVVVLEYHPQGLFEQTGNIWRAQGRRARLELKHFQRHVMSNVLLNLDDVEGWRGVIEDGEVVKDHQTALEEEQREQGEEPDESGEEPQGREDEEAGDKGPEEEYAEDEEPQEVDAGRDERSTPRRRAGADGGDGGGRSSRPVPAQADPADDRRASGRPDERPQRRARQNTTQGARQ
jgi:uncharacterized membrane protein